MLAPRLIPCLLVHNKGLVKSRKFGDHKYVGDPINAVRIFNEKEVDELIVLDIDASKNKLEPDYSMIAHLAAECRMPLCYGGGINSVEQAKKIFSLGVEKIAISSSAIKQPDLVSRIAEQVGNQSVVVVIDVKKKLFGGYEVVTENGKKGSGYDPVEFAIDVQNRGAGEIVLQSVDNDGMQNGYDLNLIDKVRQQVHIPMTVIGGAGSIDHFEQVVQKHGIIGLAAGSFFVFKGKFRAVLISYPSPDEKQKVFNY